MPIQPSRIKQAGQIPLVTAPLWCKLVQCDAIVKHAMPTADQVQDDKSPHRLSVSLTAEQYRELNKIARKNRVSVAWVVREAIDKLLRDDLPLLHVGRE
jgi:hypothetical protein